MVEEQTAASHALAREAGSLNDLLQANSNSSDAPQAAPRATGSGNSALKTGRLAGIGALGRTIAKAFGGKATAAAVAQDEWEEF